MMPHRGLSCPTGTHLEASLPSGVQPRALPDRCAGPWIKPKHPSQLPIFFSPLGGDTLAIILQLVMKTSDVNSNLGPPSYISPQCQTPGMHLGCLGPWVRWDCRALYNVLCCVILRVASSDCSSQPSSQKLK